jgi:hypothetical protein
MPLEVRANPGLTVTLKIFQGAFQVGSNINAVESGATPGFYSAPYPTLAAGEYRLEGTAGSDPLMPTSFWWSGSAEITLLSLSQQIAALVVGGGGSSGGLTAPQIALLEDIHEFSRIAKQGAVGQYVTNLFSNTGTLFEEDNATPLVVFDLKNESGAPATKNVYSRIPRSS